MNYEDTLNVTKQYLLARIPFISFKTVEKNRALSIINKVSEMIKMTVFVHSMSKGFYNLKTKEVLSDEKTIMGALDYISERLKTSENLTFVLTDVVDVDEDTLVSRYFMDIVSLAEEKGSSILVITSDPIWVHLQRTGMNITLSLPTEEEIFAIVKENIEFYKNQIKIDWDETDAKEAATVLSGISEIEIKNVLASIVAKGKITKDDLTELKFAKDKLFSNINGLEKINIDNFNQTFAGLKGLYNWLIEKKELLNPNKKEELKKRNIRPPRGILLVGVPGCGKSLSSKVIASTWKLPLYRLDFATVQGRYVGQSEQQLKEALETAEHVSPCVLWIDEIEKGLATSMSSDVTTRLVGQFLFWLQECEKEVFVIATANDVSKLPPELLRKGRFDEMFFVDLPSYNERYDIIKMYIEKYLKIQAPENLLGELARITDGFSGADIEASFRDISYKMIASDNKMNLTGQLIIDTLNKVVPISRTNPESIEYIRRWGKGRAVKANID